MSFRPGVLLFSVLGGALLAWLALRPSAPTPPPSACRFEVGEQMDFAVRYAGVVRVNPAALLGAGAAGGVASAPSTHTPTLQGILRWQVSEVGPVGATVAAVLEGAQEVPLFFGLKIDPECRFTQVGVSSTAPVEAVGRLRGLLALANVRLSSAQTWQDEIEDGLGQAILQFRRTPDGDILRKKTRYISLRGSDGMRAVVDESEGLLVQDPAGRWLRTLVAHEVVRVGYEGTDVTSSDVRLSLHRIAAGAPVEAGELEDMRWLSASDVLARPKAQAARHEAITHLRLPALLEALRLQTESKDREGALQLLMAQLRAQPQLVAQLVDRLMRRALDPETSELFFLALRELGDEPQLVALAQADLPPADLSRAWRALSKLERPGPESVGVLLGRSAESGPGGDQARLSLGTVARRVKGELRVQALRGLSEGLALAPTDSESLGASLAAIGNSGALELLPAVKPWLESTAPSTRAQAAQALRKMSSEDADRALLKLATGDTQAYVRRGAAQVLQARAKKGLGGLGVQGLREAADRLGAEPDAQARRSLIHLLGQSRDPGSQGRLAAWFQQESDDENRRAIGRFLDARALAIAR